MLEFNPISQGGGEAAFSGMPQTVAGAVSSSVNPYGTGGFLPGMTNIGTTSPADVADPNFQGFGTTDPAAQASAAAESVFPWLEAQREAGIFKPNLYAGVSPELQPHWDTVGSMMSGGGGYEFSYSPEEMNPEVASLLEGSPFLSDYYNPWEGGTFTQKPFDLLGSPGPGGSYSFNPSGIDPSVESSFDAHPFLRDFYNEAPQASPVTIEHHSDPNLIDELARAPARGLQDAIHTDYRGLFGDTGGGYGSGLLPEGYGGSWPERQAMTAGLLGDLMGQTHESYGPIESGWMSGEFDPATGLPSGADIPDNLSFSPPDWNPPEWMSGFLPSGGIEALGDAGAAMADPSAVAAGWAHGQENPASYLSGSMNLLQTMLPNIYQQGDSP